MNIIYLYIHIIFRFIFPKFSLEIDIEIKLIDNELYIIVYKLTINFTHMYMLIYFIIFYISIFTTNFLYFYISKIH